MVCMPNLFGRNNDHAPALVMHTTVEQPIARGQTGRITCRPLGQEPITFVWTPRPNRLDESESDAVDVPPGRYRVVATDATGARAGPSSTCNRRWRVRSLSLSTE